MKGFDVVMSCKDSVKADRDLFSNNEVNKMEQKNQVKKPEIAGKTEEEKCIVCNKTITGKKENLFLDQTPRTDGPIEYVGTGSQKRLSCSLECFLKDGVAAQKELEERLKEEEEGLKLEYEAALKAGKEHEGEWRIEIGSVDEKVVIAQIHSLCKFKNSPYSSYEALQNYVGITKDVNLKGIGKLGKIKLIVDGGNVEEFDMRQTYADYFYIDNLGEEVYKQGAEEHELW